MSKETTSSAPTQGKIQRVPKNMSFKDQVKERVKINRHNSKVPKEEVVWTLRFDGFECKQGASVGIELINPKGYIFFF